MPDNNLSNYQDVQEDQQEQTTTRILLAIESLGIALFEDVESLKMLVDHPAIFKLFINALSIKGKINSSEITMSDSSHVVHVQNCERRDHYHIGFHTRRSSNLHSSLFFPASNQQTDTPAAPNQQQQNQDQQGPQADHKGDQPEPGMF